MSDFLKDARRLIEQAREVNERHEGKAMPADDAEQIKRLLAEAKSLRERHEAAEEIKAQSDYLSTPVRPEFHDAPPAVATPAEKEAKRRAAFHAYLKDGYAGLTLEQKADLVEDATGENLVPTDWAGTILKELPRSGTLRSLAFVRPTKSNKVDIGSVYIDSAGWGKLETGAVAPDGLATPPAAKEQIEVFDLNALVKLGRDELADTPDNVEALIRGALVMKFGELEDDAFANGSGVGQPTGIAGNGSFSLTAATPGAVTADELKSLMYLLPLQFRRNAVFLSNTQAEEKIALLKDANNNYIWQPRVTQGEPASLFGHKFYTVDGLPAIDVDPTTDLADSAAVVFADVRNSYMVADRQRLTVQRLEEQYATEGKVGLLFTHRVGGGVIRPKGIASYLI